jgi:hypothetical protein
MKIPPVEAELSDADRRKDRHAEMTKLIVAFRHFAIDPINCGSSNFV